MLHLIVDHYKPIVFFAAAIIFLINTVIVFIPTVFSITVSVKEEDINHGMCMPKNVISDSESGSSFLNSDSGDHDDHVIIAKAYVGIWRFGFEMEGPHPFSWESSYAETADTMESMVDTMEWMDSKESQASLQGYPMLQTYGRGNKKYILFVADLVRNSTMRYKVEGILGFILSFCAVVISFLQWRFANALRIPILLGILVCHIIQAILYGIWLGDFVYIASMWTDLIGLCDDVSLVGYNCAAIVFGYLAVIGAIILAVVHIVLLLKVREEDPYKLSSKGEEANMM